METPIERRVHQNVNNMTLLNGNITPVHAQNTAIANSAIDEIVVTARKRAEGLQNVPVAVSVVTGTKLEEQGIGLPLI
jgi:iron complex outermembrane recepter protein